jgi:dTDP-glucose 4,6-dehydratase
MKKKNLANKTSTNNRAPQPFKILVTGGCGFIGSNFIRFELENYNNVIIINLDKLTYAGNLISLADIEQKYGRNPKSRLRYFFVRGDISDRNLVDSLLSGKYFKDREISGGNQNSLLLVPDAIVNFAAESHVDRSILDASPFIDTNVKGTQVLLEAARSHWLNPAMKLTRLNVFVHISTDEVYGSLGKSGKFTENSPLLPNSPYAASKAAADLLCRSYYNAYSLPVIITRSSNNYGPYQFPEKLIPLMIKNALEGRRLPVYGKGSNIRDWLYVEDNCRAIDFVLRKGKPGEIYNIGGGEEFKNIEVVKLICKILKEKGKVNSEVDELIEFITDPRGNAHDYRYSLDCSKIKKELTWQPSHEFTHGLKKTIGWYLENQEWIKKVVTGEYKEYYKKIYGNT